MSKLKITLSEFKASMGDITFPLAVALSGGADSLALLLLAHELAKERGSDVVALTVDHNLRLESKAEALCVGKWAKERGIKHVILEWVGDKPPSRLQEKARKARYALLTEWCKNNQISTLLLGHHQQDQEETFWLRLSSGSGLDGLGGIKKRTTRNGIVFFRPLLDFSKERIKATLLAQNQEWIEDPSNQNPHFFRGRLRNFFQEEGLSSFRLLQVIKKLQRDADFIQSSLQKTIETTVQVHDGGYLTVKRQFFNELHPAIGSRLLSFLLQWFSNADYAPRTTQVAGILDKIKRGSTFTMGGIYWTFSREDIFLFREMNAIAEGFLLAPLQEKTLWDQRFWIDPKLKEYVPKETMLGSLGAVPSLKKEVHSLIPARVWPTLPALWEKGKVVVIPHLCYDPLEYGKDLRKFIYLKPLFHDSLRFTI